MPTATCTWVSCIDSKKKTSPNAYMPVGHALNKLLKDFINRWKAQNGYRVRCVRAATYVVRDVNRPHYSYIPGWDCHGLPIEHKALQSLGVCAPSPSFRSTLNRTHQESHLNLSPQAVRQAARKTALAAIEVQKDQFRQLGIMADWDDPKETYRTLGESASRRSGPLC